jgi:hypothetical protein
LIRDYSQAGLVEDQLQLSWRIAGTKEWSQVRLEPTGADGAFRATIEGAAPGQTVEYFLSAADRSGRRETLPRTAPKGFYTFQVGK